MSPSEPLSHADFRALRHLVSGQVEIVPPEQRERLVAGDWVREDAGAYFLTDKGRAFVLQVRPEYFADHKEP